MTVYESLLQHQTGPRVWAQRPRHVAGRQRAFPVSNVVAEIKPHTASGVRDGIRQLRGRRAELGTRGRDTRYHLITYRPVDGKPATFEVFISHPGSMGSVMSGSGTPTFLRMGDTPIHFPRAVEPIPVHQCPTLLGTELEPLIRARYAAWMRSTQGHGDFRLEDKSASRIGADIRHELVEFLRELAAELEAESY